MEELTVVDLGAEVGKLADAVLARNWLGVLQALPVAQTAISQFVAGYVNRPRGATPLERGDFEPLVLAEGRLVDACRTATEEIGRARSAPGAADEADPRGFGPAEILAILQIVQAIGLFIKSWRDNRTS